ncbi:Vitamin B12 transporter BtuB [Alphaproteobacteria bacterium SO-S41]|nr:Vitamin B12 transporter BtuB [Alphaproteobacteria bacterium SO-S41]
MSVSVRLTQLLLAGACLSVLPYAAAQTPADPATPATETTTTTSVQETGEAEEELTVTATRRATNIQKTSIAITAIPEKTIENAGIRDTQSLTAVVPSLSFPQSESSGSVTARIRGVGTQGSNPGLESAVGIFIDGVYRSRNSTAFGDLGDIKRVEVLRGPQGTLFGRNTSAGLISVITREPSLDETIATATATYESFKGFYLTGGITAPIVKDEAGFRLFGSYRKRDGYMDILSGPGPSVRDGNKKDDWNLRGQLLWKPSDTVSLRFIVDGAHKDDECCYAAVVRPGSFGRAGGGTVAQVIQQILGYPGTATTNTVEDQVGYANREHPQIVDEFGGSVELTAELGWGSLTSVTGYRDWKLAGGSDADYTAADYLWTDPSVGFQHFKTFTQEFRLAGSDGGIDWLVGAFYSNETLDRETSTLNGSNTEAFISLYRLGASPTQTRTTLGAVPLVRPGSPTYAALYGNVNTHALGTGLHDYYSQDAESIAIFTHNTITITDALKLTLGLRYTSETKDVSATYRTNSNAGCAYEEGIFGLNPNGTSNFGAGPGAAVYCLPWTRTALDKLTASAPLQQSKTENEFSGVITLSYEFAQNFNAYATYSRGYKAGGFNLDRYFSVDNGTFAGSSIVRCPDGSDGSPAQRDLLGNIVSPARPYTCANPTTVVAPDLSFKPEFVDAFEIGAKTSFMDGKLTANLAIYHQKFTDYQLNTFTGISFVVTSVPEVLADGVELDLNWFTDIEGLSFTGGLAYNNTRYGKNLGDYNTPGSFVYENPNLVFLPGENLTSAPTWTLTGGFTYEFPVFGGAWNGLIHMDARHVNDQRTGSNLDPAKTQEAYTVANLRLGLSTEDDMFTIELWAQNVFDERYYQISFDAPLAGDAPTAFNRTPATFSQIGGFLAEPRTLGVTLKTRF